MIETLATLAMASGHDLNAVVRSDNGVAKPEQWLMQWAGGGPTVSGVRVGPDNAMQVAAVYACVNLRSRLMASLPLFLFRRGRSDSRRIADDHPLYSILHDAPNPWMTSFEWREMMQGHLDLRGNAYSYVMRDNSARLIALIPLHPDKVTPLKAPDGQPFYRVLDRDTGISGVFPRSQVLHLRGHSSDGYVGLSPIAAQRETIGLAIATREHGGRLFSNGTVTSGVLEYPQTLNEDVVIRLRKQWEDQYTGNKNAHKPLILEGGMKWTALGMTSEDAQFLGTRSFQNHDIYRIFETPPVLVGDNEKTTSWGTGVEQITIGFVTYTLTPLCRRWENVISQTLLLPEERSSYFAEFELDGLLRGDQKSRNESLALKRQNGIINANEWRRLDNLDPIPGPSGDAYLVNGAMIGTESAAAAQKPPNQAPNSPTRSENAEIS